MRDKSQHIVFINQHYWPDNAATALALTDLAEHLSSNGFQVSIICSRYLYDHSGEELPAFELKNGVQIHRVKQTNYGRYSHSGRLRDYASFFIRALWKSFQLKPDTIITLTTPPLLGTIGWLHKLTRSVSFIYWAMDLHPEAEIAANMISANSTVAKIATSFHDKVISSADKIVTLSSNMKSRILNYSVLPSKVSQISIWSDSKEILSHAKDEVKELSELVWRDKFIIQYSGNLGLAHHFESLLNCMISLTDPEIAFVFTGGGPQMPVLKKRVHDLKLKNVYFQPYVAREGLSKSLAKADVQWFSLDPSFEGIAYPSKLVGYMASGRPIVFLGAFDSDSAKVIKDAQCGFSFKIDETTQIVNTLLKLKEDSELRLEFGKNARSFFEEHLSKEVCCSQWQSLIESVTE